MVRVNLQIRPQKLFARRLAASTRRFYSDEDHIQTSQRLGIVASQHPPLVCIVLIKQAKAHRSGPIAAASPNLKRHILFAARLAVEIETVKYKRAVPGIEDAAELLGGSTVLIGVEDVGDVEVARADQI